MKIIIADYKTCNDCLDKRNLCHGILRCLKARYEIVDITDFQNRMLNEK